MRVVLDTNVLGSALIKEGKPRALLDRLIAGRHTVIISRHMIEEFSRVTADKRIRRYVTAEDAARFIRLLTGIGLVADTKLKLNLLRTPDDLILSAAYDGLADVVVTGDRHLLALGSFKGIKIVTVSAAIDLLSPQQRRMP